MPTTVDLLLVGGTVITVDRQRPIYRDGAVAVQGAEIVAVGKRADLAPRFEARATRDCRGKVIMPGLVNSHLHFYHTMHRGLAPEDLGGWLWSNYVHGKIATVLTPEDEIAGGLTVLVEALKCGTTTFLEAGSYNPAAVIEGASRIGMRGLMGRRCFDQAILGHAMLLEDTDTCLRANERFLTAYRDGFQGGLIRPCVDIVGLGRCTDRLYVESRRMADRHGAVLNLHLAAMTEEVTDTRMRTGLRPVENLHRLGVLGPNVVLVHMIHVADREIRLLAETGTNGARALGLEREIGSLEPGKKADIILLNTRRADWCPNYSEVQNLAYSASGDSVETAWIDGRLVMDGRRVLTVDEGEVVDRCNALAEKLLARSGVTVPSRWPVL